jgi:hypothetical protein
MCTYDNQDLKANLLSKRICLVHARGLIARGVVLPMDTTITLLVVAIPRPQQCIALCQRLQGLLFISAREAAAPAPPLHVHRCSGYWPACSTTKARRRAHLQSLRITHAQRTSATPCYELHLLITQRWRITPSTDQMHPTEGGRNACMPACLHAAEASSDGPRAHRRSGVLKHLLIAAPLAAEALGLGVVAAARAARAQRLGAAAVRAGAVVQQHVLRRAVADGRSSRRRGIQIISCSTSRAAPCVRHLPGGRALSPLAVALLTGSGAADQPVPAAAPTSG